MECEDVRPHDVVRRAACGGLVRGCRCGRHASKAEEPGTWQRVGDAVVPHWLTVYAGAGRGHGRASLRATSGPSQMRRVRLCRWHLLSGDRCYRSGRDVTANVDVNTLLAKCISDDSW